MHEAFTPLIFHRYNRPLHGLMIDNQPWFAARDFGLLMGHRHPERICRLADDDQIRTVSFAQAGGGEEMVEVISESAAYRALCRFTHPENRNLRRWLTHEVIPTLRDVRNPDIQAPRRTLMNWGTQRVSLLEWQGKLWIPLNELPDFSQIDADRQQSARLGLLQRWLR